MSSDLAIFLLFLVTDILFAIAFSLKAFFYDDYTKLVAHDIN